MRLPCVYVWRAQGGYGQFACHGVPVSFSNPVAALALATSSSGICRFSVILENGRQINLNAFNVRRALAWLKLNNPLYTDTEINDEALNDIGLTQTSGDPVPSTLSYDDPSTDDFARTVFNEQTIGTQGPIDGEALHFSSQPVVLGTEDLDNFEHCKLLIEHMLRPFNHRQSDMIPSYNAAHHLESYFPVHFPYGRGGPASLGLQFGN